MYLTVPRLFSDNNFSDDHFSYKSMAYHISDMDIFPTDHIFDMVRAGVQGAAAP